MAVTAKGKSSSQTRLRRKQTSAPRQATTHPVQDVKVNNHRPKPQTPPAREDVPELVYDSETTSDDSAWFDEEQPKQSSSPSHSPPSPPPPPPQPVPKANIHVKIAPLIQARVGRKIRDYERQIGASFLRGTWFEMDHLKQDVRRHVQAIGELERPPLKVFTLPGEPSQVDPFPFLRTGQYIDVGDVFFMEI